MKQEDGRPGAARAGAATAARAAAGGGHATAPSSSIAVAGGDRRESPPERVECSPFLAASSAWRLADVTRESEEHGHGSRVRRSQGNTRRSVGVRF